MDRRESREGSKNSSSRVYNFFFSALRMEFLLLSSYFYYYLLALARKAVQVEFLEKLVTSFKGGQDGAGAESELLLLRFRSVAANPFYNPTSEEAAVREGANIVFKVFSPPHSSSIDFHVKHINQKIPSQFFVMWRRLIREKC